MPIIKTKKYPTNAQGTSQKGSIKLGRNYVLATQGQNLTEIMSNKTGSKTNELEKVDDS